jgi:hypothetical protein
MSIYQQTTSPLDQTREAGPHEHAQAAVAVQDAARSLPGDQMTEGIGITEGTAETSMPPGRAPRQFAYPEWPTSKPGPEVTSPLPGQKPHPMRTDQMVYEYYDQERGMSCVPPPTQVVGKNRTRTYSPDASLPEVDSEKAMERWLDDGGTADHEAA